MTYIFGRYFLILIVTVIGCKSVDKQPAATGNKLEQVRQPLVSNNHPYSSDGFELIWEDNAENVSASWYDINPESMVFGKKALFYISGPKLPEGGSFTQVKALDLKNRELKWKYKFVHEHLTKIDYEDSLVFFTGDCGFTLDEHTHVFALDAETGKQVWKTKIEYLPFGGIYDMAVYKNTVYLIRERNIADQKTIYELLELHAKTGEIKRISELGYNFMTHMGLYNGPFFLTKMNPGTLKKELVTANGNLFVIGRKWNERVIKKNLSYNEFNVVQAISVSTGKPVWEYQNNPENNMVGWQLNDNAKIIHFNGPLNPVGHTGLNLQNGKEISALHDLITHPYSGQRPQWTDYNTHEIEAVQQETNYRIRYKREDIFVYEKSKK